MRTVIKANLSVNKLQRLVNDLLDVSAIQAGKLAYAFSTINLSTLIRECFENSEHIYPGYAFQNQDGKGFFVHGNIDRLEQVLMNLINNAVKYSQANKNIILKAAAFDGYVRISVTDFGIGLSDEQKEHIFERFYRVEDKKYMTSGLGVGLFISAQIVGHHKGKIGVESELGKGSIFYFDLPLL